LFPEQAVNWDWMRDRIKMSENKNLRILNLFAYTGGATMAAEMESNVVEVVHVDAAKGMVEWAKENAKLSKLEDKHIRYIVDDVVKFVQREARRGRTYHGIILDPPSYGRGPNGEMWKLEDQLVPLIKECMEILDKDALFLILNSYTTGLSVTAIENILKTTILSEFDGQVEVSEIGNAIELRDMVLPCGVTGLWFR
jgi:23S rRNA (cytosine1962-C5)-methyltransferase